MQLNDLRVNLTLDDKGFNLTVKDAERTLRTFEQRMDKTSASVQKIENHFTSFGSKAHRMVMTLGMARFALMDVYDIFIRLPASIITTTGEIERMTKMMEGLSKESDEAKRKLEAVSNVEFVFGMAQNAPFEVKALTDAFIKLKTGGLDPTDGSLQALVDSVAKFGGNSEVLKRAAIAIQQMGGKGVISMEELRQQLGEAVPTAMAAMARGMKMSMAQLAKAVSDGTVESQTALGKMLVVMSIENDGAAAKMMDTWTGMLEQLKTKWELFKFKIGETAAFDRTKKALQDLLDAFDSSASSSFADSIGHSLDTAVAGIIRVTEVIVEFWDWIKAAGTAWLAFWAFEKVRGLVDARINSFNALTKKINENKDSVNSARNAEIQTLVGQARAEANLAQAQIARNNKIIADEKRRTAIERAERLRRVQDEIAANDAIMGANRTRIREAADAARAVANSSDVAAVARGTATPAQDLNAQVLLRTAERTKEAADAAGAYNRKIQERNVLLRQEANLLRNSTGALSAQSIALRAQNADLRTVVDGHRDHVRQLENGVRAGGMFTGFMRTLKLELMTMLSPLTLITAGVMAVAGAFTYFANQAREAANQAKAAIDLKNQLAKGRPSQETTEQVKRQVAANDQNIAALRKSDGQNIYGSDGRIVGKHDNKKRIAELEAQNREYRADLERAKALFTEEEADAQAAHTIRQIEKNRVEALSKLKTEHDKAERSIADEIAATSPDNAKRMAELQKNLAEVQTANDRAYKRAQLGIIQRERATIDNQLKGLAANKNSPQYLAAKATLKTIEDQYVDIARQIAMQEKANVTYDTKGNKDKKPKKTPTDSVINALASEQVKMADAKNRMEELTSNVSEITDIRKRMELKVEAMIESDGIKGKKKVHTEQQKQDLIDAMTNREVIEEASKVLNSLEGKIAPMKEKAMRLRADIAGGIMTPDSKRQDGTIAYLERLKAQAPDAALKIQAVIDAVKELNQWSSEVDAGMAIQANEKRIQEGRVAVIVDARERIAAQGRAEVREIQEKYAKLKEAAGENRDYILTLNQQMTDELRIQAAKQAIALETPLEKLQKSWSNTTETMHKATEKWAGGFMDLLTESATTGKLEFGKFAQSVMADIMRMEMQKTIGSSVASVSKSLGTMANGGEEGGSIVAGLLGKAGEYLGIFTKKTDAASESLGTNLTAASEGAVTQMAQQVAAGVTTVTAEGTAAGSLGMLSFAADNAAMSLAAMADTGGGGGAGSFLANMAMAIAGGSGDVPGAAPGAVKNELFANGGIMTEFGAAPLRKYARGGIANSPQVAIYGEGSMSEAYVPLPDGRSIPVTMTGGGGGVGNVTVNVINQSGTAVSAQQGTPRFDGRQMVLDVVLSAVTAPGGFRDGMKQALR